ncbi:MAG TPA: R3H domain-containing nucleic acid-binding protein [Thermoanaerobaculia bacterium]|nr:R3H domain-containing nucleic acid-binding protein [Thermoanaerobaculia bacterium]
MSQRFEGKSLDEALDSACEALGVERFALTYHVLLEKRGFLGGMKRVVVEADVNPGAIADAPRKQEPRPGEPTRDSAREPVEEDRAFRSANSEGRKRKSRSESGGAPRKSTPRPPRSGEEAPAQETESPFALRVHAWFDSLVEHADWDMQVRTFEGDERVTVRLYGSDEGRFVEQGGELLDAVQLIASKAFINDESPEKRVEVDCASFRENRSREIEELARGLADQVRSAGGEQMLPSMNPMERRIVHVALQDDAEVETESRGEGFFKRVAIIPRRTAISPES